MSNSLIKLQALLRGSLTRKRLKRDPHFFRLFHKPRKSLVSSSLYDRLSLDDYDHNDLMDYSRRRHEERLKAMRPDDDRVKAEESDEIGSLSDSEDGEEKYEQPAEPVPDSSHLLSDPSHAITIPDSLPTDSNKDPQPDDPQAEVLFQGSEDSKDPPVDSPINPEISSYREGSEREIEVKLAEYRSEVASPSEEQSAEASVPAVRLEDAKEPDSEQGLSDLSSPLRATRSESLPPSAAYPVFELVLRAQDSPEPTEDRQFAVAPNTVYQRMDTASPEPLAAEFPIEEQRPQSPRSVVEGNEAEDTSAKREISIPAVAVTDTPEARLQTEQPPASRQEATAAKAIPPQDRPLSPGPASDDSLTERELVVNTDNQEPNSLSPLANTPFFPASMLFTPTTETRQEVTPNFLQETDSFAPAAPLETAFFAPIEGDINSQPVPVLTTKVTEFVLPVSIPAEEAATDQQEEWTGLPEACSAPSENVHLKPFATSPPLLDAESKEISEHPPAPVPPSAEFSPKRSFDDRLQLEEIKSSPMPERTIERQSIREKDASPPPEIELINAARLTSNKGADKETAGTIHDRAKESDSSSEYEELAESAYHGRESRLAEAQNHPKEPLFSKAAAEIQPTFRTDTPHVHKEVAAPATTAPHVPTSPGPITENSVRPSFRTPSFSGTPKTPLRNIDEIPKIPSFRATEIDKVEETKTKTAVEVTVTPVIHLKESPQAPSQSLSESSDSSSSCSSAHAVVNIMPLPTLPKQGINQFAEGVMRMPVQMKVGKAVPQPPLRPRLRPKSIKSRSRDASLSLLNSEVQSNMSKTSVKSHSYTKSSLNQTLPPAKKQLREWVSTMHQEQTKGKTLPGKYGKRTQTPERRLGQMGGNKKWASPYDFQWSKRMLERVFRIGVEMKSKQNVYFPEMKVRKLRKSKGRFAELEGLRDEMELVSQIEEI